jgi:hypothetical protein
MIRRLSFPAALSHPTWGAERPQEQRAPRPARQGTRSSRRALLRAIAGVAMTLAGLHPAAAQGPWPNWPPQIAIQVWSYPADVRWGGGGYLDTRAYIFLRVTRTTDGAPINDLGLSVGDSTRPIELPEGLALRTVLGPHAEAYLLPVEFLNLGSGIYRLKIAPFRYWRPGQYLYTVEYRRAGTAASAAGTLDIPF